MALCGCRPLRLSESRLGGQSKGREQARWPAAFSRQDASLSIRILAGVSVPLPVDQGARACPVETRPLDALELGPASKVVRAAVRI